MPTSACPSISTFAWLSLRGGQVARSRRPNGRCMWRPMVAQPVPPSVPAPFPRTYTLTPKTRNVGNRARRMGGALTVKPMLRLVIAGGGTGGHVHPALAVVEEMRGRGLPLEFLWIGSHGDMEGPAAKRAAIPFRAIQTGKLRRYFSAQTLLDVVRLPIGTAQAWRLLRAFRPDVIFSTGGFVSVPTVVAGARLAPILTHEQTAILGLATRINLRFADVLAVSFERSTSRARSFKGRIVLTGNPVRGSLRNGDAVRAHNHFGFLPDLPVLYITGGARGASPLNQRIAPLLPDLLETCQIIHQTGPATANSDYATLSQLHRSLPAHLQSRYHPTEFVRENLADVYAVASLVLCRAGAGTIAELSYLGKPGLLIPLPRRCRWRSHPLPGRRHSRSPPLRPPTPPQRPRPSPLHGNQRNHHLPP